jgi:hypothetical protein
MLARVNQARYGHKVGDDGGCFAAALDAVRRWGGGVGRNPRVYDDGGNEMTWELTDCGASSSGVHPHVICWCGFTHRNNAMTMPYRCLPFSILKTKPELRDAFLACGFDPQRPGEVGIVLERDLDALQRRTEGTK